MPRRQPKDPLRLSRLEVLGAWTHTWTPHRDAEIPPIPWRKIWIATAIGVVALGAAAALIVPAIQSSKDRAAKRDAAQLAADYAADVKRITKLEHPTFGKAPKPSNFDSLSPAGQRAMRARLFQTAQQDMLVDAKARVKTHEFNRDIQAISCDEYPPRPADEKTHPETNLRKRVGVWDCTAVQDYITVPGKDDAGAFGYPFRLKVDFKRFSYVWCRENPPPGERAMLDPRKVVGLPRVCAP
jgi:type II secretory pathway pseudopilin PulG